MSSSNHQDSNEAPIRPYEADGIRELDNNLPSWWVGLFVFTGVFALLYLVYVHLIGGTSIKKEYADSLKVTYAAPENSPGESDEPKDLNAMVGHAGSIAKGKETFTANCAPCHGSNGEGKIGPNLTDKFWLHGGKPEQIYATILNGAPEKGMPAWGSILGEQKVRQLAAFVTSLKGTNPPNPKAPQGTEEP
jgi:cytochrome c oxidase cbb3-type subunit III